MRIAAFVIVVGVTGCQAVLGFEDPALPAEDEPEPLDVPQPRAALAALDFCLGSLLPICTPSEPTDAVVLSATIDTNDAALCATDTSLSDAACVVVGASIVANTGILVTGTRPLVLFATNTVELRSVSFSNHSPAPCPSTPGKAGGAGGGTGGSLGDTGAIGGASPTGSGATTVPAMDAFELRFGCPGQDGGHIGVGLPATGGRGGGAMYVAAGTTLSITSSISVSGGGGDGGAIGANGGGGGGSGGMILLDAPTIALSEYSSLYANGGGGGEGGGGSHAGTPGSGTNGGDGTAGGDGGAGASFYSYTIGLTEPSSYENDAVPGGNTTATNTGAGGGGGGAGVIELIGNVVVTPES